MQLLACLSLKSVHSCCFCLLLYSPYHGCSCVCDRAHPHSAAVVLAALLLQQQKHSHDVRC